MLKKNYNDYYREKYVACHPCTSLVQLSTLPFLGFEIDRVKILVFCEYYIFLNIKHIFIFVLQRCGYIMYLMVYI